MAGPLWFHGIDAIADLFFALVTFLVAARAYRVCSFIHEDRCALLWQGFGLLSISYLLLAMAHGFIFLEVREGVTLPALLQIMSMTRAASLAHAILFLGGIVILLFLYLEIDRIIVRGLIFALVFFVFVLANNMGAAFYLLVALLLVFIIAKLTSRYRERKARSLLLVGCGLSGVLLGEVFFAAVAIHPLLYVFATLMTFLGYVLVLFQVRR